MAHNVAARARDVQALWMDISSIRALSVRSSLPSWITPSEHAFCLEVHGDLYALLHPQLHFPIWGRPSVQHCQLQTPSFRCWRLSSSKSPALEVFNDHGLIAMLRHVCVSGTSLVQSSDMHQSAETLPLPRSTAD